MLNAINYNFISQQPFILYTDNKAHE
jgi:hypothetical protein